MDEEMLEAHVAFEVAAWTQDLAYTLGDLVEAVIEWLDGVSLGSIFSASDLDASIAALPVPDLTTSIVAVHAAALNDETPMADLVDREDYDRIVDALAGMEDLQEAIVEQITTSEVYSNLISHVLFHGIRNYVITESPIARVPGASSLMRMGQNAFDSAAPKLSKGIEKQLTAFVSANLQDTLRESRNYLTRVLNEEAIGEVSDDIYVRNADLSLAEMAALIPEDTLVELADVVRVVWGYVIQTDSFREAMHAVLGANSARPVGEILAEADITASAVVAQLSPWILRAADDGLLETLVRQRLTAFYENYE